VVYSCKEDEAVTMDMETARLRLMHQLSQEIRDKRVLDAMSRVPRELFVPPSSQHAAYENIPLPIDMGQTISQPYIVALMTEAMELTGKEKVLEVGTGSGYQTAILCELANRVVTVERHQRLLDRAKDVLTMLAYTNVEFHLTEKTLGWPQGAPYDAIIVTAGAPKAPQVLLDQLALDGRLVIPVGSRFEQDLMQVIKRKEGAVTTNLGACRFVPLIGEGAWDED
jgi:protein-L-isoaspartate(D-aspartate) O-methyltransferase